MNEATVGTYAVAKAVSPGQGLLVQAIGLLLVI